MFPRPLRPSLAVLTATALLFGIGTARLRAEDPPKGPPVVSFKLLLPFLPAALAGWSAEKPEGNTIRMGAMEITTVSTKFNKGDSTASVEIIDYALQREVMKGLMLGWQFSNESTEGYQKGVKIDGVPAYETFTEADRETNLFLVVGDRYWLHINVRGEQPEVARAWLGKVDLKALADVK
ncbi:hypothetical protein AYO41_01100 [Verrucomicrobia bacterium SCGC AG-212-E04]|nr:hypothetical protein AYO41_01100 [Verrucomicrobia bacterium SCGC AG-212-E04]